MQAMLTVRSEPGMRRVMDALGPMASEGRRIQENSGRVSAAPDAREYLIRGHRRVLELYRELLATHEMPQSEHESILERIATIEAELRSYGAAGFSQDGRQTKPASLLGSRRADHVYQRAA
jgi:hypothetical protein